MKLYLRMAWRNVWRYRRRSLIIALAMSMSLMMMMLYDGLLEGFDQAIYGNAIQVLGGNIQVHAEGYREKANQNPLLPLPDDQAVVQAALANPQVLTAFRRITTGGLITSPEGAFAVSIIGIEPEEEAAINLAAKNIIAGRYLTSEDADFIFIGKGLADAMGVGVGDRVTLNGRTKTEQMRQRTMTVVGIYDLNMGAYEKTSLFISLAEAQELYGLSGQITEVAVALKQVGQEPAVLSVLKPALPGYEVDSWEADIPELANALNSKNGVMTIFSIVIMSIAGIGILNLLLMAVYERTREIGVLGALGFRPGQIALLFIFEGIFLGLLGVAAGVVLGLITNAVLGQVGIDYSFATDITSYTALINDRIYSTFGLDKLLLRAVTVVIISALAAVIPAREAAQREPVNALHYV